VVLTLSVAVGSYGWERCSIAPSAFRCSCRRRKGTDWQLHPENGMGSRSESERPVMAHLRHCALASLAVQSGSSSRVGPEEPFDHDERARSHAPAPTKAAPVIRAIHRPAGVIFSTRTRIAMPAIHSTFITPPTKSSAISAQQHPMQ